MKKFSLPFVLTSLAFLLFDNRSFSQTIANFNSVTPTDQTQSFVLPPTHVFQKIIQSGDALSAGGVLGPYPDFTAYVPIGGSSANGYLSISSEITPAGVGILDISFNTSLKKWMVSSGGNVGFLPSTDATGIGEVSRFCSGTVTPNNTVIVCEEDISGIDNNGDGYIDRGWLIEIDPATRTVINQDGTGEGDKLWAIGRAAHENAVIKSDNMVLYTGADDNSHGFLYKFIPVVAGNFSSGTLYVLETTAALGTGSWKLLANSTIAERNNTRALSAVASAYNFSGIEDVEIGPGGKIYFAAKNSGVIYRFTDNGTVGTSTDISGLEIFVGNSSAGIAYDIDGAGSLPPEPWGLGNDNLAFDGEGNLWVCQDGGRNHIWVVGATHTQALPKVSVFATTPAGCEPTGITFTPDYKFIFLSFMHPLGSNAVVQVDATGAPVQFNEHTTVVISRFENLGSAAPLPVNITGFSLQETDKWVQLNWSVSNAINHSHFEIERSVDGKRFEKIYNEQKAIINSTAQHFNFSDDSYPKNSFVYYRIKQVDKGGSFQYSATQIIRPGKEMAFSSIYPVPAQNLLNIHYYSKKQHDITIQIMDAAGRSLLLENRKILPGDHLLNVMVQSLKKGNYTISISQSEKILYTKQFVKL